MGFNDAGWRLDDTVHPFETSFSVNDVRLTTRYAETYFPTGLYGAMHECGHGLYEAGVAPELAAHATRLDPLERDPRVAEPSVGEHGRARPAFTDRAAPGGRRAIRAGRSTAWTRRRCSARSTRCQPSTIRIEADETTYGLHIVLRFELERALLAGELAVADLPEAWNARMREYLGVEVPSDAEGVLQDVHWSAGLIGYFPTYAIGNLIAGQLWERGAGRHPRPRRAARRGTSCRALREWLREHVHRHGSRYTDAELLDRVVGGPIAVGPVHRLSEGEAR